MKHALIAAALLSLGGVAAGCGGNDSASDADASSASSSSSPSGAPTDASATELCSALTSGSSIKTGADVVAFAKGLEQAGTPSDIPADARKGFETYVSVLEDIDPKLTAKQLQTMKDPDLSKAQQLSVQSFLQYAGQACAAGAASPSQGSGSPSDGAS
ncbi:hypothetical protein ACT8ZV_14885 [Nocardioides sp. MAHUQ-72]|uniref:hypothetical protein n=1 Tax=unclassified Nocardioides TaxID=2615069 RepID=UPI003608A922